MSTSNGIRAYVVERDEQAAIVEMTETSLPDGDVTVHVHYSSVNYKDGLAVLGKGGVVRNFPMVPGIDLAGTVVASDSDRFSVGDSVFATGFGLGERHPGGYAQLQRVHSDWLLRTPSNLSLQDVMTVGTAGFTAMLCVDALKRGGVSPGAGPVQA